MSANAQARAGSALVAAARTAAVLALALMASCAQPPTAGTPPAGVAPPAGARPPPAGALPSDGASPPAGAAPSARTRPAPIPDRRIDLAGRCTQIEEDGYREDATLDIDDNVVRALSWQLWAGRRGICRFELPEFRQTRRRPHIELLSTDGAGCKLMVWQDPRRVTLAHAGCESRCTAGIYDQTWPVAFDARTGRCAAQRD